MNSFFIYGQDKYEIPDKVQDLIGEGTYGQVYRGKNTRTQEIVAIKKIKLENEDEGVPQTALREISILKELQPHPSIVNMQEVVYQPQQKNLCLVFEYVDQDLKKFLDQYRKDKKLKLASHQIKIMMYQILNGLNFCHSRRIIHRDLKPQNILIDKQANIKIADFGLSRAFGVPIKTLTHEVETLWYRAPEILLGQKTYSLGVDIWSLGCIFHEMVEKKALFMGDSEIDQIFKIFQFHGTPTELTWPSLKECPYFKPTYPRFKPADPSTYFKNFCPKGFDLISKMVALDPAQRISVKEALRHPYFDDLSQEELSKFDPPVQNSLLF